MVRVIVDPPLMSSDDQQREVACQQGHVLAPDLDEVFSAVFELGLKGSQIVQRWVQKWEMCVCVGGRVVMLMIAPE